MTILKRKKEEEQIEFVHGIGKRKSKLQKFNEELEKFYERQKNYDTHNQLLDGRNSYSKTDPDATFMHMKDDHMNNSQLKPGYNVQIGVESEYVTGVGIFQDRSDNTTLIPFLNDMESNLGNKYQNIIADSGYESEENYLYLEEKNQKYYINHRHMKSGRRKVLKMILVSVKTWFMIKIKMNIPATMENNLDQLESSIGLQQVATVQKLLYTNVKTATIVHINQNVQKHEATERCKYQKYL